MGRPKNKRTDVWQYINMQGGDKSKCWEWTGGLSGRDKRPYFNVDGKRQLAYRIVFEDFFGVKLDNGEVVRHKCDNKVCCNPHHHERGTHQENMDDMKERERHGLPHHTVKAIRKALRNIAEKNSRMPTYDDFKFVADIFGQSVSNIKHIYYGRTYQHVLDGEEEEEAQ